MSDDDIHPEAAVAPGYLANHAARLFNRNVDTRLRAHGLSLSLLGPILLLSWRGPMRQRDLVAHSAVKQPAMVALLDRLEGMGLILRSPAHDDRRAAVVSLTEAGREMALAGGDALRAENARGITNLSEDEAKKFTELLQRFVSGLAGDEGT